MRRFLPLLLLPALAGAAAAQTARTVSVAPMVSTTVTDQSAYMLSDFGSQAELDRFDRGSIPASHFTPATGAGALLSFDRWQPGAPEWPALALRANKGLLKDWRSYDCLAVDVRNQSDTAFDLALFARDIHGVAAGHHFSIAPGKTQTLRWPLLQIDNVDLSQVVEAQLYTTRPRANTTLLVSNFRLERNPEARRTAVTEIVASVNTAFAQHLRETKDATARRLMERAQSAGLDLQARLNTTQDRTEQDRLLSELIAEKRALDQKVPREAAEERMRREFRKIDREAPYACGFTTSMEKVFPVDIPFNAVVSRTAPTVSLAGNETESIQLLILADKQDLQDVQVTAGALTRADGRPAPPAGLTPTVQIAPVGFVKTTRPSYKVDYVGWYPDPILDFLSRVTVKAGEMQPIWIRVTAPENTPAGEYTTTLTVRPANAPPVTLKLRAAVWGFSLPRETHLRTAVSFREPSLTQVYGSVSESLRQRYYRFLLSYRINPDNIYRYDTPALSDLKLWNRLGMNAFNLVYVVKPAGLKTGDPYPPEQKAKILAQLDEIIPQLKANGLYSKAYVYGFDEVSSVSYAAMKDIFSAIHDKYPDLLILTTAKDATLGVKSGLSMVNGWVPLTPDYNLKRAEEARKQGKQVWWYTCIVPQKPYANWFIEYDAIDARSLMGLQSVKYKTDGHLYYAVDRWPLSKKPITFGPYTDWPPQSIPGANGDGSYLCAGPDGPLATIRMENIRDGIEDYEYFWLLGEEIKKLKANPQTDSAIVLQQAEQAAIVDDSLVKDLTHFSKSPEAIYAKRRQVAEAILAARKITAPGL